MDKNKKPLGEIINEVFNDYFNKSIEYSQKIDKILKEEYLTISKFQKFFIISYVKAARLLDELIDLGYITDTNSKFVSKIKKEFIEEIKKHIYEFLMYSKNNKN